MFGTFEILRAKSFEKSLKEGKNEANVVLILVGFGCYFSDLMFFFSLLSSLLRGGLEMMMVVGGGFLS
jgi:hypothetical protein